LDQVPLGALLIALACLILLSAFFSAAEIGLMTLNRYRLRHLAASGRRGARLSQALLERPDRLLGIILLGNNFANIAASSVATILGFKLYGDTGIAVAAGLLTLLILVFGEVAPKTLAAMHPERVALPAAYVLKPLLVGLYPLVWLINALANRVLRLFGVSLHRPNEHLSTEELKAAVTEAGSLLPETHQSMVLAILDLEKISVEDVMVPRGEIEGVDLDAEWDEIADQLARSRFTRLPAYRGSLDNVAGMIHLRRVLHLTSNGRLTREALMQAVQEPYFIPKGTPLNTQLLNFKTTRHRAGLVVDEYGDIAGLVTLEEILEEIVGEFTTQSPSATDDVYPQADGSYLVNGSANIRELNRTLKWDLPIDGPKTLNGLIVEYLEDIPVPGTSFLLDGYLVEILRTRGTAVQVVRMRPNLPRAAGSNG
jgi:Mg2+/Co2+ transporter CorB